MDAEPLAACIDAAYSIYTGRGIDLPAVSDGIADDIQDNIVFVADRGGKIIGGIVLALKEDHALLQNVAVDAAAAGLGIGRALMERAELEVQKFGFKIFKLSTHVGMPENVLLYTHLGWSETKRLGNKVFMEKIINATGKLQL